MPLTPILPENQYDNGVILGYGNLLNASSTSDVEALTPNTYERSREVAGAVTMKFNTPSDASVNFVGIAAHNLSGETITISYATTVGGATTVIDIMTVADNDPIFVTLDAITIREIILTYTGSKATEVGYVSSGSYLQMPYPIYGGHTPINLSPKTEYQNNISESGQFLGRNVVRQGVESSYSFRYLDPDFVRGEFNDFVVSARTKPFFVQWRNDLYPDESAFVFTTGDVNVSNSGGGTRLMSAEFSVRGHRDI